MRKLLKGLEILCKYEEDGGVCAEHDVIYAGGTYPDKISEEDMETLEDNGWSFDFILGCWKTFT